MLIPNQIAYYSTAGGYNLHGEPAFSTERPIPSAIVHLVPQTARTSVRTDSTASRGNAEEFLADATILLMPVLVPEQEHRLRIAGQVLKAHSIEPRYDVTGKLDHYECKYQVWK